MANFSACGVPNNGNASKRFILLLLLKNSPPVRAAKIFGDFFDDQGSLEPKTHPLSKIWLLTRGGERAKKRWGREKREEGKRERGKRRWGEEKIEERRGMY